MIGLPLRYFAPTSCTRPNDEVLLRCSEYESFFAYLGTRQEANRQRKKADGVEPFDSTVEEQGTSTTTSTRGIFEIRTQNQAVS